MSDTTETPDPEDAGYIGERPDSKLDRAVNALGVGLFTLLLIFGAAQVLFRFVISPLFGFTVAWTGEASRFTLIYLTFLGSVIASRESDHIQIEVFLNLLPQKYRVFPEILLRALTICFAAIGIYTGYLATKSMIGVPPGAVPVISMAMVFVAIPVGFLFMLLYELGHLRDTLKQAVSIYGDSNG